jgi:dipeptidyl aminopeptidase/acylaminoacyl peptidase
LDTSACALPADAAARWIAFDSNSGGENRDTYLVRADGSRLTRLTNERTTETSPALSNSGTRLAFVSDRDGTSQIYVMNLRTHAVVRVTAAGNGADAPSWSKDDSQIVFQSGQYMYVVGADGKNQRSVDTIQPGGAPFSRPYPAFLPDGAHIVFADSNGIETTDLDGTGYRSIVGGFVETPALSPDAVNVAFGVQGVPGDQPVQQIAGIRLGPGRDAADLRDGSPYARGRQAHVVRRGRRRAELVERRPSDCLRERVVRVRDGRGR